MDELISILSTLDLPEADRFLQSEMLISELRKDIVFMLIENVPLSLLREAVETRSELSSKAILGLSLLAYGMEYDIPLEYSLLAARILAFCALPRLPKASVFVIFNALSLAYSILIKAMARETTNKIINVPRRRTQSAPQTGLLSQTLLSSQGLSDIDLCFDDTSELISVEEAIATIVNIIESMTLYFTGVISAYLTVDEGTIASTTVIELLSQLLNKPIRRTTLSQEMLTRCITGCVNLLGALLRSLPSQRGILLYELCRLLAINPSGRYRLTGHVSIRSITTLQECVHTLLVDFLGLTNTCKDPSPDILPVLQFVLVHIQELSSLRSPGATAVVKLLNHVLTLPEVREKDSLLDDFLTFLEALSSQGRRQPRLVAIEVISTLLNTDSIATLLITSTLRIEAFFLRLLVPLGCSSDDTVAAIALLVISRTYITKGVDNALQTLTRPLCLSYFANERCNVRIRKIIDPVALRKSYTQFLGSCLRSRIDSVITELFSTGVRTEDTLEPTRKSTSTSRKVLIERANDCIDEEGSETSLNFSMLETNQENVLPPHLLPCHRIFETLSDNTRELLFLAKQKVTKMLGVVQLASLNDYLVEELVLRCQDSSPSVRKAAISVVLSCATIIPLPLWFECVFNSAPDTADSSSNPVLTYVREIIVAPVALSLKAKTTEVYPISPLLCSVLYHLALQGVGSEQRVAETSLSNTLRDAFKQYNVLELVYDDVEPQSDQAYCVCAGALILATGCVTLCHLCRIDMVELDIHGVNVAESGVTATTSNTNTIYAHSTGLGSSACSLGPLRNSNVGLTHALLGLGHLYEICMSLLLDTVLAMRSQDVKRVAKAIRLPWLEKRCTQEWKHILAHDAEPNLKETLLHHCCSGIDAFAQIYGICDALDARPTHLSKYIAVNEDIISEALTLIGTLFKTLADESLDTLAYEFLISRPHIPIAFVTHLCSLVQLHTGDASDSIGNIRVVFTDLRDSFLQQLRDVVVVLNILLQDNNVTTLNLGAAILTALGFDPVFLRQAGSIENVGMAQLQLRFHLLYSFIGKQLVIQEEVQGLVDLLLALEELLNSVLHRCLQGGTNDATELEQEDANLLIQTSGVCTCILGAIASCLGVATMLVDSTAETSNLATCLSTLLHTSLHSFSTPARNNALLALASLCYTAPDTASGYMTLYLGLTGERKGLLHRHLLLVIGDLFLKDYLRVEPVPILLVLASVAHNFDLEARLFAQKTFIEPLVRKQPSLIPQVFIDMLILLSGVIYQQRDPVSIISRQILALLSGDIVAQRYLVENTLGIFVEAMSLKDALTKTLRSRCTINDMRVRRDFYMYLISHATPAQRFEILTIILSELLDRIETHESLLALQRPVGDFLALLERGAFAYDASTLIDQLMGPGTQTEEVLAPKATVVADMIIHLSHKHSSSRLLPALLNLYSLSRGGRTPLTLELATAIHKILEYAKVDFRQLDGTYPQYGQELLELRLMISPPSEEEQG
ncbi:hypothetical protein GMRT_10884 [Giardia muris]|uniref:Uncharacterized protein n=1 Tax=Giardia muris TaxID=5742 RepID=A0A4Z1SRT7_GIAMU|nr:hypothetical protein GMRT_10884 [Giardia muris]|eukprot:TNJ28622.1 hypothetical protein GMRT_10884 [Giardia muris]